MNHRLFQQAGPFLRHKEQEGKVVFGNERGDQLRLSVNLGDELGDRDEKHFYPYHLHPLSYPEPG
jgi:hypothetical protein